MEDRPAELEGKIEEHDTNIEANLIIRNDLETKIHLETEMMINYFRSGLSFKTFDYEDEEDEGERDLSLEKLLKDNILLRKETEGLGQMCGEAREDRACLARQLDSLGAGTSEAGAGEAAWQLPEQFRSDGEQLCSDILTG